MEGMVTHDRAGPTWNTFIKRKRPYVLSACESVHSFFPPLYHLIINTSSCNGDIKQKHRPARLGWTKETMRVKQKRERWTEESHFEVFLFFLNMINENNIWVICLINVWSKLTVTWNDCQSLICGQSSNAHDPSSRLFEDKFNLFQWQ